MTTPKQYFDRLNQEYLTIHREKEDLFWTTYMGTSNDTEGFSLAEKKWSHFISSTKQLVSIRATLKALHSKGESDLLNGELEKGLKGWLALFEANVLEKEEAKKLKGELIADEASLFEKRKN